MNPDELREQLIQQVTEIIVSHNFTHDYGSLCRICRKQLYGEGNGSTLSRHRAEQIVDRMNLVKYLGEHC